MMCFPSGASVWSNTVGISTSANGSSAPRPARASWNPRSRYSMSSSTAIAPPWTFGLKPGSAVNSGSSASARLTFTTPERVRQCSMSETNSGGSFDRGICFRNVICGWHVVITTPARSSSPPTRATPRARPRLISTRSTGALTRISAPKASAERRIASATAPIPPSGIPQEETLPSASSPIEWWSST